MGIEKVGIKLIQKTAKALKKTVTSNNFSALKSITNNTENTSKKLLHIVKKDFVEKDALIDFFEKNPNAERRIGSLPYDWIKNFNKNEISDITYRLDEIFSNYSRQVKDILEINKRNIINIETYNDKLLQQLKKILKRDDISIEYAGNGTFKTCQKITIGKHSYALSTFKDTHLVKNSLEKHGYMYEQQNSFAIYKQGAHGRISKPFMAKVCREYDIDGYILSQFIDGTKKKASKSIFETQFENLYNKDAGPRNHINNVYFDFGGFTKNKYFIKNKQERILGLRLVKILQGKNYNMTSHNLLNELFKGKDITSRDFYKQIDIKNLMKFRISEDAKYKKGLYYKLICKTEPYSKMYNIVQRIFSNSKIDYEQIALKDMKYIKSSMKTIKKLQSIKTELEKMGVWEKYNEFINTYFGFLPKFI